MPSLSSETQWKSHHWTDHKEKAVGSSTCSRLPSHTTLSWLIQPSSGLEQNTANNCSHFLCVSSVILPFSAVTQQTSKEATLCSPILASGSISRSGTASEPTSRAICGVAETVEAQKFMAMASADPDEKLQNGRPRRPCGCGENLPLAGIQWH